MTAATSVSYYIMLNTKSPTYLKPSRITNAGEKQGSSDKQLQGRPDLSASVPVLEISYNQLKYLIRAGA